MEETNSLLASASVFLSFGYEPSTTYKKLFVLPPESREENQLT